MGRNIPERLKEAVGQSFPTFIEPELSLLYTKEPDFTPFYCVLMTSLVNFQNFPSLLSFEVLRPKFYKHIVHFPFLLQDQHIPFASACSL
jgi:hypothetical protein